MGLDFFLSDSNGSTLDSRSITHNLHEMLDEAGVGDILWYGDGKVAMDIVGTLREGLALMESDEERFRKFDSENGWGTYPNALRFLRSVISICDEYPAGIIYCSR